MSREAAAEAYVKLVNEISPNWKYLNA